MNTVQQIPAITDEPSLTASLEGVPEQGDYFEIVVRSEETIPSSFTGQFPAIRIIFRTHAYTIIRAYIGAISATEKQINALLNATEKHAIIGYTRAYPGRWGE